MNGPDSPRERPREGEENARKRPSPGRPPGEFLTDDLASATARFLDDVKRRIHRAAESDRKPPRRPG